MNEKDNTTTTPETNVRIVGGGLRTAQTQSTYLKPWYVAARWAFIVFGGLVGLALGIGLLSVFGWYMFQKQIASEKAALSSSAAANSASDAAKVSATESDRSALASEKSKASAMEAVTDADKAATSADAAAERAKKAATEADTAKSLAMTAKEESQKLKQETSDILLRVAERQATIDELITKLPDVELLNNAVMQVAKAEKDSKEAKEAAQNAKKQVERIVQDVVSIGVASQSLIKTADKYKANDPQVYASLIESIKKLDREFDSNSSLNEHVGKPEQLARKIVVAKLQLRAAQVTLNPDQRKEFVDEATVLCNSVLQDKTLPARERAESMILSAHLNALRKDGTPQEALLVSFKRENKESLSELDRQLIDSQIIRERMRMTSKDTGVALSPADSEVKLAVFVSNHVPRRSNDKTTEAVSADARAADLLKLFRSMYAHYSKRDILSSELALSQSMVALELERTEPNAAIKKKYRDYASKSAEKAISIYQKEPENCLDLELTFSTELLNACRIASCGDSSGETLDILRIAALENGFKKQLPSSMGNQAFRSWLAEFVEHLKAKNNAPSTTPSTIYNAASSCISCGQFGSAEALLHSAVATHPYDPCPHYLQSINDFVSRGVPIETNPSTIRAIELEKSYGCPSDTFQNATFRLPGPLKSLLANLRAKCIR